jgi:hypothetical protein
MVVVVVVAAQSWLSKCIWVASLKNKLSFLFFSSFKFDTRYFDTMKICTFKTIFRYCCYYYCYIFYTSPHTYTYHDTNFLGSMLIEWMKIFEFFVVTLTKECTFERIRLQYNKYRFSYLFFSKTKQALQCMRRCVVRLHDCRQRAYSIYPPR